MKIRNKITVSMVTIACFGLVSIAIMSSIVGRVTVIQETKNDLLADSEDQAHLLADILGEKIKIAKTMSSAPVIIESLRASNAAFSSISETQRKNKINELNTQWINTRAVQDPFIQSYINNPSAQYLKKQQQLLQGEYGEIFLTDRYGALVATTGKLTTLVHAHKYWWKAAYAKKSVIDDRGYDESVGDRVFGVVVPIFEEGEIIGILKCNLFVNKPLKELYQKQSDSLKHNRAYVLRANGDIVYNDEHKNIIDVLGKNGISNLSKKMRKGLSQVEIISSNSKMYVTAFAPVTVNFTFDAAKASGQDDIIDHRKGNIGYDWYAVILTDLETHMVSLEQGTKKTVMVGIMLILLMALTAFIVSLRLTTPLKKLIQSVKSIGKGDFACTIDISSKDEIGDLAVSFRHMAEDLNSFMKKEKEFILADARVKSEKKKIEELRSLNQQLTANEQQLKSANQQLLASEQRLKSSNQQLSANEQGQKAANLSLEEKVKEITKMNDLMTGRELRTIELKKEINGLCEELGRPKPYSGGIT